MPFPRLGFIRAKRRVIPLPVGGECKECRMTKFALYVPLQAKPGKEKDVADFLRSAVPLVNAEPGTISWFAIQEGPSSFAIFDTFDDEAGRDALETALTGWAGGFEPPNGGIKICPTTLIERGFSPD